MARHPVLTLRDGKRYLLRNGLVGIAKLLPEEEIENYWDGRSTFRMEGWNYDEDGRLHGIGWDDPYSIVKEIFRLTVRRPSICRSLKDEYIREEEPTADW